MRRGGDTGSARPDASLGVVSLLSGDLPAAEAALDAAKPLFDHETRDGGVVSLRRSRGQDCRPTSGALSRYWTGGCCNASTCCATLYNNLSAALERAADYDRAREVAERGVQEDATLASLHKNVGDLQYRAGRYDEALESYVRAAKSNPELGGDLYLKLGNIRLRRHERDEAVKCWERALELAPNNAIVRTNLESVRQVY